jgi:hypothetical protein
VCYVNVYDRRRVVNFMEGFDKRLIVQITQLPQAQKDAPGFAKGAWIGRLLPMQVQRSDGRNLISQQPLGLNNCFGIGIAEAVEILRQAEFYNAAEWYERNVPSDMYLLFESQACYEIVPD